MLRSCCVFTKPIVCLYIHLCTAPTSNPLLPTIISLVVLLLIICVDLLALALAVTATKLIKLRAEKALNCYNLAGGGEGRTAEEVYEEMDEGPRERRCHSDRLHCYNQTGGGEGEATDRIYDEVGEGTDPVGGQKGHYQELKLETMDRRQYETLHGGH